MIDRIDQSILQALVADGRASVETVAERVGLSTTPVRRRIRRLEAEGIIRGYRADIDLRRMGLELGFYVFVKLRSREKSNVEEFEARVKSLPEILRCDMITGAHDFVLMLRCETMDRYNEFLRHNLTDLPGVFGIETSVVVAEVKAAQF